MEKETNEFYIGWQEVAPDGISRRVKQFVLAICIVVPVVGSLLVMNQQGFAQSTFEYGQPTELEGVLVNNPAPFLQIYQGKDVEGNPVFQNILLVATGKHGIGTFLSDLENKAGRKLDGQQLKMRGSLIYHDGKTLMEVEKSTQLIINTTGVAPKPSLQTLGAGAFVGEITDPKCLFGVMKPGYGKPHRSCGARCIAGGIPPVLKTISIDGHLQYYLLANEDGTSINQQVLPYVGDQVIVCGEVKKEGEWLVLYKTSDKAIELAPKGMRKEIPLCN